MSSSCMLSQSSLVLRGRSSCPVAKVALARQSTDDTSKRVLERTAWRAYFVGAGPDERIVAEVATNVGGDHLTIYPVTRNEVLILAVRGIRRRAGAVVSSRRHGSLLCREWKAGFVPDSRGEDEGEGDEEAEVSLEGEEGSSRRSLEGGEKRTETRETETLEVLGGRNG